jgi:hypothetical protein
MILLDRIEKGMGNGLLPNDVLELLGPVFPC